MLQLGHCNCATIPSRALPIYLSTCGTVPDTYSNGCSLYMSAGRIRAHGPSESSRLWASLMQASQVDALRKFFLCSFRLPLLLRGWDWGLVKFIRARLANSDRTIAEHLMGAWKNWKQPGLAQRLADATMRHGIRVVIVHGTNDKLIPVNNSKRLAALIPGAAFVEYPACGHVPHEEYPQKFVDTLKSLLSQL